MFRALPFLSHKSHITDRFGRIYNIAQVWLLIFVALIAFDVGLGLGLHVDKISPDAIMTMTSIGLAVNAVYSKSSSTVRCDASQAIMVDPPTYVPR